MRGEPAYSQSCRNIEFKEPEYLITDCENGDCLPLTTKLDLGKCYVNDVGIIKLQTN